MSKETRTGNWYVRDPKCEAIYNVLRHLARFPKEGIDRVGDDAAAIKLFNDNSGGLKVPENEGARVIFFTPNEGENFGLEVGSSVIIRVPPMGVNPNLTDAELKKLCILGNYPYWPPTKP